MRVAVRHTDETHPNAHWFAFEQGRIQDFRNPVTGETLSAEQVAAALLVRAMEQFPEADGYEHRIETLHVTGSDEDGNDTGGWFPAGESDLPRVGQAGVSARELSVDQGQAAAD